MLQWALILLVHVSPIGKTDSVALTTSYFRTEQLCSQAGEAAKNMVKRTVKDVAYVCVPTGA